MPSSMLPRSSGKPIRGQRLSSAKTWPPSYTSSIGRCRPCTTSLPLSFNSSRLPARMKSEVIVSIGGLSDERSCRGIQRARFTNVNPAARYRNNPRWRANRCHCVRLIGSRPAIPSILLPTVWKRGFCSSGQNQTDDTQSGCGFSLQRTPVLTSPREAGLERFYEGAESLFVRAYDAFYAGDTPPIAGDIAFYDRLAQATGGGPLLELGCGTGRIALALARPGSRSPASMSRLACWRWPGARASGSPPPQAAASLSWKGTWAGSTWGGVSAWPSLPSARGLWRRAACDRQGP